MRSSTKAEIVAQAEKVFTDKDVRFVGGHPWLVVIRQVLQQQMQPYLKMPIIFLPFQLDDRGAMEELKELLSGLGSRFIEIDAEEHDR